MNRGRLLSLAAAFAAPGLVFSGAAQAHGLNHKPSFIVGSIGEKRYDGVTDDLLTGGLGKTGLQVAVQPQCTLPIPSTAERLRTCAIYFNYRALADMTPNGGYGRLYGPNIDLNGGDTLGEGLIAGTETIAYAGSESGRDNVVLMVQVPESFDRKKPCIVTGTSSGSRGIYGAIGTTGEWGLKRGCAVAYTDKGTGNGVHDVMNDTVNLIDGTRTTADAAGKRSHFTARLSGEQQEDFNQATPNRFAIKHAHSRRNPEQDWGRHTLWAVEFAFFVLNEKFGHSRHGGKHKQRRIVPENTLVIASSVSNGGGAAIAAAEEDRHGLIDAVVVSEPQVQLPPHPRVTVLRGGTQVTGGQKPLLDYTSWANLYQPCAALAPANAASPFLFFLNAARAANRCQALKDKGLVAGATLAEQATDALAKLNAHGWEADSNLLHASHYAFFVAPAVATTYVNAHGRFSVRRNVCGFSYGATDAAGAPAPLAAAALGAIFSTGNGVPPNSGINLINNLSPGGPLKDDFSTSPSSMLQDFNLDGALCIRDLATGRDTVSGRRLHGSDDELSDRVRDGIQETFRNGNLHGKPAIIVHGRNDALIPVNHTSRPYLGLNRQVERWRSNLHYYEVTNAQHFEAFLPLAGYDTRLIPLHVYGIQALNLMYAHLTSGAPLPPSQVVRTTPRGGTPGLAPEITTANVPPIPALPSAADRILVSPGHVSVPN